MFSLRILIWLTVPKGYCPPDREAMATGRAVQQAEQELGP